MAHPVNGPKSVRKINPRAVGVGGGPPKSVPSEGANRADDIGLAGKEAATVGRKKKSAQAPALAVTLAANGKGADVKGQRVTGDVGTGAYKPGKSGDADSGKRAKNPVGNPGHHPSTSAYEHSGSTHSSKDR